MTITLFKTYSYGGLEGRDIEVKTFATIEQAKQDALNNTWNSGYQLYEVVASTTGKLVERFICDIPCGRDIKRVPTLVIEKYKNQ